LAGGGFDYVSCPHFLGEIILYGGLLLVTGREMVLPWLVFAWVVSLSHRMLGLPSRMHPVHVTMKLVILP
jgi:3-oxo-5-alpha-steroid 4-dehydrogenase